nr:hypothetical protein [Tanacetum cinerariifolium]
SDEINPHCFNVESDFVESFSNRDTLIDSSPKFDFLEKFSGAFMPTSVADKELQDNDFQKEKIDIVTNTDELLPPSIESDDYDSEGEIDVLEELRVDNSIPKSENKLSDNKGGKGARKVEEPGEVRSFDENERL